MAAEDSSATGLNADAGPAAPSRLQSELAARILRWLKEQGAEPGKRLIELELCEHFGVSRTPIRGALKQLAAQGLVEARANRGFILVDAVPDKPIAEPVNVQDEEDRRLIAAMAEARSSGKLPTECAQQEICRMFKVKLPTALRVLRQLADIGLVERKAGNGWSFLPLADSKRALAESYAFRELIEPTLVLQPTYELDRAWLKDMKTRHLAFRKKTWRKDLSMEFYDINSSFHDGLARCSGNRYLLGAVRRQIQLRSFLKLNWDFDVERVRTSTDEHLQIIEALERDDRVRASELIRDHLGHSRAAKDRLAGADTVD